MANSIVSTKRARRASYASFVGPLELERPTFRKVGVRNGPTVVPLDLAAGLLHGTTPALAWRIARGAAKRSRMAHGRWCSGPGS